MSHAMHIADHVTCFHKTHNLLYLPRFHAEGVSNLLCKLQEISVNLTKQTHSILQYSLDTTDE